MNRCVEKEQPEHLRLSSVEMLWEVFGLYHLVSACKSLSRVIAECKHFTQCFLSYRVTVFQDNGLYFYVNILHYLRFASLVSDKDFNTSLCSRTMKYVALHIIFTVNAHN